MKLEPTLRAICPSCYSEFQRGRNPRGNMRAVEWKYVGEQNDELGKPAGVIYQCPERHSFLESSIRIFNRTLKHYVSKR